jgi:hypothetical protein
MMNAHAEIKECIGDLQGPEDIHFAYGALKLPEPATPIDLAPGNCPLLA